MRHAAGEHNAQPSPKFIAERAVTLCLGGLTLQGVHLTGHFVEDVVHAGKILLRGLQPEFGEALLRLKTGDAGCLFDDGAAVVGLGREKLADALLADDGVGLTAQAGAHKDVLNVAQPADLPIEQVLTVTGAKEAASDGQLAGADRSASELAAANLENDIIGIGRLCSLNRFSDYLRTLGFAFNDCAGLGLGDGFFSLGGVLLAKAGLVPVSGYRLVDDDLRSGVEARGSCHRRPPDQRG